MAVRSEQTLGMRKYVELPVMPAELFWKVTKGANVLFTLIPIQEEVGNST